MSFTGLGSAVTFAQLVIFSVCRRFMQNSGVARGGWQGGKPRNRNEVTQLTGTPGVLGHTIDLGNAVAWSSCVAESSKASYQVGWRSWVRCCQPFGYDPYCMPTSGRTLEILEQVASDSARKVYLSGICAHAATACDQFRANCQFFPC